jgi:molybdate transport system permease protein
VVRHPAAVHLARRGDRSGDRQPAADLQGRARGLRGDRSAQAARTLGAGEFEIFARVGLPLAVRGIAAGLMLAFARAMGEFGATLMVAGNLPGQTQTLSIAVYDAVQAGNDAQALWLTALISAVCVVVLLASGRLLQARH